MVIKNCQMNNTNPNLSLISLSSATQLEVKHLSDPGVLEMISREIKEIYPGKRKLTVDDFLLLMDQKPTEYQVVDAIAGAINRADDQRSLVIWDMCAMPLKHALIVPDAGVLNTDLVKKLDVNGEMVRSAFLSTKNFGSPHQTAYAYVYGEHSAETGAELVLILKKLWNMQPEGKMLINEFFYEIDIRILYLFAVTEAEQFAHNDALGGAFLQLAIESEDVVPCEAYLLSWLQQYAPSTFKILRDELLNPVWQENRTMFWKGWARQNRPDIGEDLYEKREQSIKGLIAGGNSEDDLDELLKVHEENDS